MAGDGRYPQPAKLKFHLVRVRDTIEADAKIEKVETPD